MDPGDDADVIDIVARRIDFLETLAAEPAHKPTLVESLPHSRSTVDRAIRTLEDAGLVERADEGYVTTITGRLVAERYRAFLAEERDVLAAQDALAPLPHSSAIPVAVLSSASVATGSGDYWLFEHIGERLRAADRYHAVLPRLADSRHLRLVQARVERGALQATIHLATDALARCREEFPRLAATLAESDGLTIERGDAPAYGLVLFEHQESTTVALVTYDETGVAGFIRSEEPDAVAWVRQRLADCSAEATDAAGALRDVDLGEVTALTERGQRLSPTLRSQGFVRVDAAFLDRREPDPETDWLPSPGHPAGADHTVEHDDVLSALADVEQRLRTGSDVAVLGSPDSATSRLCKQVAVRWHETADGAVLYRESGGGQPFEAIGALESAIEYDPGHTLVVVEDAVRSDANTVFDVMQAVSGRADVSFLLDSCETEWQDGDALPIDARLEAFRQEVIETVTVADAEATTTRSGR